MIISYDEGIDQIKRITSKATITYEHQGARYGLPVVVLENGEVFDWMSWRLFECKVIEASDEEMEALEDLIAGIGNAR